MIANLIKSLFAGIPPTQSARLTGTEENHLTSNLQYGLHPSIELQQLFKERPYQGQHPAKANVLIVGNDANYSPEISEHKFFQRILEYHKDGVGFWKRHQKHHPFLLPEYPFDRRRGGVKYHATFSKLGFSSEYSERISFVELLNVPTIGNTGDDKKLFFELLDKDHLSWLEDIILGGDKKFVLVNQTLSNSILKIQKNFGVFKRLKKALDGKKAPSIILENDNVEIYNGYSFSHSVSNEYLKNLRFEINKFLGQAHKGKGGVNPH
ncbi:MAG TPA: hypothetical protein VJ987_02365 [Anaerolineales bacterium]|nr:hypothetical protein [Anaerolineales bacterium]